MLKNKEISLNSELQNWKKNQGYSNVLFVLTPWCPLCCKQQIITKDMLLSCLLNIQGITFQWN